MHIHLTAEETKRFEDHGEIGDKFRREVGRRAIEMSRENDCRTVEVYADEGYVLEAYQAEREESVKAETFEAEVTLEHMPEHLCDSHRKAGNWGVYPHNGAIRERMTRGEAAEIIAGDADGYAHIVEEEP